MNELEKHLSERRSQLDIHEVNPRLWTSIETEIRKRKTTLWDRLIPIIIVIVTVFLAGILYYLYSSKINTINENELIAQFDLEEFQFLQQVELKMNALSKVMIPSKKKVDFDVLVNQLHFLDNQQNAYLSQIEQNGFQSLRKDQLLHHYESKIALLDKIHQEIIKSNYYEKKFPTDDTMVELQL